ncbi:MAG: serine hydrolase [Acidobacteriota bacterium]
MTLRDPSTRRTLSPSAILCAVGLLLLGAASGLARDPGSELPTATPEDVGLSTESLTELVEVIQTTPPADFRGLVVLKDGRLVVEEYFYTYWRDTIHDIRSAGKSVTSLLFGIAIDKGYVDSADQRLVELFPEVSSRTGTDDGFADITLRHVLTMTSGLDADDDRNDSPGRTGAWITRPDWVDYILSLPMRAAPGEQWTYTDVSPILLGAIIEKASGQRLDAFAREHLFDPLGIREVYWYTGVGGQTGAAGNLYLSTLDFAKLGQLMLDEGLWRGKRIVSASWVRESVRQQRDISDTNPFSTGYGFLWYQSTVTVGDRQHAAYSASGNGGNVLMVVPDLQLVVAVMSSAYGQGYGHQRTRNVIGRVLEAIVPSSEPPVATTLTGRLVLPDGRGSRGVEIVVTETVVTDTGDGERPQRRWVLFDDDGRFTHTVQGRVLRVSVSTGLWNELHRIESDALPAIDAAGRIDLGTIDLRDRLIQHRMVVRAAAGAPPGEVRMALCFGPPPVGPNGGRVALGSRQFPPIPLGSEVDWLLPRGARDVHFLAERPAPSNDGSWRTGYQRLFGPFTVENLPTELRMD